MTIIGSAYVDIRAITDKLQIDIEEALASLPDNIDINVNANTSAAEEHVNKFVEEEDLEEIIIDIDVSTAVAKTHFDDFVADAESHEVVVDIDVNTAGASEHLDDFMAAEDTRTINVDVDLDTMAARFNLGEFLLEWGTKAVNLFVTARTAAAEIALDILARPRIAEIITKVKGNSLKGLENSAKNIGTFLMGISGMSTFKGLVEEAIQAKVHIAELLPTIVMTSERIAGMATAGLGAAGGLLSLGQSIVQLVGVLPVLPGVLVGLEIAMKITTLAFSDMKKAVPDLAKEMQSFKDMIAKDFWSEARTGLEDLISGTGVFRNAMAETSKTVGSFWGTMFEGMSKGSFAKAMAGDFANLNTGIKTITNSSSVFLHIFETLGEFGSAYIPKMADGFVDMAKRFDEFLTRTNADGTLTRWASQGIQAFKDLGSVIGNLWNVFGGLADAATKAGGMTMGVLGESLKRLADTIHTADFQKNLVMLFQGANYAIGQVVEGFSRLMGAVGYLAPALKVVEEQVGQTFGNILKIVSGIIARPEVFKGIQDMFGGILEGVNKFFVAIAPMGDKLGAIMSFIGGLATTIGDVVAHAAEILLPAVQNILDQVKPLIPLFGDVTKKIEDVFGGAIKVLVDDILPPAVDWLKKILPPISDLIKAITPDVVELLKAFARSLTFGKGDGAQKEADGISALAKSIKDGQGDFKTWADGLKGLDEATAWMTSTKHTQDFHNSTVSMFNDFGKNNRQLSDDIHKTAADIWNGMAKGVDDMNKGVNKALDDFWGDAKRNNEGMSKDFKKGWDDFWGGLKSGTNDLNKNVNKALDDFWTDARKNNEIASAKMKKDWDKFWGDLDHDTKPFQETVDKIDDNLRKLWGSLVSRPVENLGKAWDKAWGDMKSSNEKLSKEINTNIDKWWSGVTGDFNKGAKAVGDEWDKAWKGFKTTNEKLSKDIDKNISQWWSDVSAGWTTESTKISTKWDKMWGDVKTSNTKLSGEVNKNIDQWWSDVSAGWTTSSTQISTWWDSTWGDMKSSNERLSADINKNISQWWSDVQAGWTTASTQLSTGWDQMWSGFNGMMGDWGKSIQKGAEDVWAGIQKSWDEAMRVMHDIEERGWDAIFEFLNGLWQKMLDAGGHIIDGLIKGIQDGVGAVAKAAEDVANGIGDTIRKILGIASPSKVMYEVGMFTAQGLANGIDDHMHLAITAMSNATSKVIDAAQINIPPMSFNSAFGAEQGQNTNIFAAANHGQNMPVPGSYGYQHAGATTVVKPTVIINPAQGMDEKQIGQMAATEIYWTYLNR